MGKIGRIGPRSVIVAAQAPETPGADAQGGAALPRNAGGKGFRVGVVAKDAPRGCNCVSRPVTPERQPVNQ